MSVSCVLLCDSKCLRILTHFEMQCTVRLMQRDPCVFRLLLGWLTHTAPSSLHPCRTVLFWVSYLLAWAVGSNAEGSCVSNGRVSICALNLPFWGLAKLMLDTGIQYPPEFGFSHTYTGNKGNFQADFWVSLLYLNVGIFLIGLYRLRRFCE